MKVDELKLILENVFNFDIMLKLRRLMSVKTYTIEDVKLEIENCSDSSEREELMIFKQSIEDNDVMIFSFPDNIKLIDYIRLQKIG